MSVGMGEVYADGLLTPMGCLMLFLRSAQNSPRLRLLADGEKELEEEGVYALAWQHRRLAALLLTNPWPQAAVLPAAYRLLPCREVRRAYRIGQFHGNQEVDSASEESIGVLDRSVSQEFGPLSKAYTV